MGTPPWPRRFGDEWREGKVQGMSRQTYCRSDISKREVKFGAQVKVPTLPHIDPNLHFTNTYQLERL